LNWLSSTDASRPARATVWLNRAGIHHDQNRTHNACAYRVISADRDHGRIHISQVRELSEVADLDYEETQRARALQTT
jgi:hypothetical protein